MFLPTNPMKSVLFAVAVIAGVIAASLNDGGDGRIVAQEQNKKQDTKQAVVGRDQIKPVATIKLDAATGRRLTFTPDSKTLAAYDGTFDRIRSWEVMTGKELAEVPVAQTPGDGSIAFSPDGCFLALTHLSWGKFAVRLWDWKNKREVARVDGTEIPRGPAFSPDGKTLAFIDAKHLYFFGIDERKIMHKLRNKEDFLGPVFSADSKKVAIAGELGRRLHIMDREGGAEDKVIRITEGSEQAWFQSIHWSKDGKSIIARGPSALTFWDVATGKKVKQIDASTKEKLGSLAVSPDEKFAATDTVRGNLVIWDLTTSKQTIFLGSGFPKFSADGKLLAILYPSEVRVWDFAEFIKHSSGLR